MKIVVLLPSGHCGFWSKIYCILIVVVPYMQSILSRIAFIFFSLHLRYVFWLWHSLALIYLPLNYLTLSCLGFTFIPEAICTYLLQVWAYFSHQFFKYFLITPSFSLPTGIGHKFRFFAVSAQIPEVLLICFQSIFSFMFYFHNFCHLIVISIDYFCCHNIFCPVSLFITRSSD